MFSMVNRRFVLSFEDDADRNSTHNGYFLPKVEVKDYNVMINGKNFFDQSVKNDWITYDNTLIMSRR